MFHTVRCALLGLLLRQKPLKFKETLSGQHAQFSGAHQHDCQEFLALLLDAMHEELKLSNKINQLNKYESDCGTSMELHTAQSTEKQEASTTDNEDEDKDLPW